MNNLFWSEMVNDHKVYIAIAMLDLYRMCLCPNTLYAWLVIQPDGNVLPGAIIADPDGLDMEIEGGMTIRVRTSNPDNRDDLSCLLFPGAYLAPVADIIDAIGFDIGRLWDEVLEDAAHRDSVLVW